MVERVVRVAPAAPVWAVTEEMAEREAAMGSAERAATVAPAAPAVTAAAAASSTPHQLY
jgi:hypothetical protein